MDAKLYYRNGRQVKCNDLVILERISNYELKVITGLSTRGPLKVIGYGKERSLFRNGWVEYIIVTEPGERHAVRARLSWARPCEKDEQPSDYSFHELIEAMKNSSNQD